MTLFNQLKRTHPALKTLEVSVKADLEYVSDEVDLIHFHTSSTPNSTTYTFHEPAQRTLSDKLEARIAESPAKWENMMDLVESLRDEDLESRMVMRGMRIPVGMLGELSDDFLRNCGGFEIDMGSNWGRGSVMTMRTMMRRTTMNRRAKKRKRRGVT